MLDSGVESLAKSESRFRFLDALATETRRLTEPADVMQVSARMLGQHLLVNRCAYARVEADQDHFELLGYVIVGIFLAAWAASVVLWKLTRIKEANDASAGAHVHMHDHDSGLHHSHRHFH